MWTLAAYRRTRGQAWFARSEDRRPLGAVLRSSNEPGELWQWLCYDENTKHSTERRRLYFCLCLSVCLSAKLFEKLWTDFDEISWRGGAWPKHESIRFSRWSGSDPGSEFLYPVRDPGPEFRDPGHDPERLIFKRIFWWNFGGMGRGPRNSRLDFGGDPDYDKDPGIFFKDSLLTIKISTNS